MRFFFKAFKDKSNQNPKALSFPQETMFDWSLKHKRVFHLIITSSPESWASSHPKSQAGGWTEKQGSGWQLGERQLEYGVDGTFLSRVAKSSPLYPSSCSLMRSVGFKETYTHVFKPTPCHGARGSVHEESVHHFLLSKRKILIKLQISWTIISDK